ncbi:hypothetical protein ACJRO7_006950 [Eucalyptus globulus]|uniref:Uncharacterized protein n=1 Tax=Eucalyptus globulus TaxID=34317 RepID=A0ABD3IN05_EUCGL
MARIGPPPDTGLVPCQPGMSGHRNIGRAVLLHLGLSFRTSPLVNCAGRRRCSGVDIKEHDLGGAPSRPSRSDPEAIEPERAAPNESPPSQLILSILELIVPAARNLSHQISNFQLSTSSA